MIPRRRVKQQGNSTSSMEQPSLSAKCSVQCAGSGCGKWASDRSWWEALGLWWEQPPCNVFINWELELIMWEQLGRLPSKGSPVDLIWEHPPCNVLNLVGGRGILPHQLGAIQPLPFHLNIMGATLYVFSSWSSFFNHLTLLTWPPGGSRGAQNSPKTP